VRWRLIAIVPLLITTATGPIRPTAVGRIGSLQAHCGRSTRCEGHLCRSRSSSRFAVASGASLALAESLAAGAVPCQWQLLHPNLPVAAVRHWGSENG
jgi:hypothetical protein